MEGGDGVAARVRERREAGGFGLRTKVHGADGFETGEGSGGFGVRSRRVSHVRAWKRWLVMVESAGHTLDGGAAAWRVKEGIEQGREMGARVGRVTCGMRARAGQMQESERLLHLPHPLASVVLDRI